MHVDLLVSLAGLAVGLVVGLTGMGGGALLTPLLVLGFGVAPLTAVSSDLVASMVMKPVGAGVHLRRRTVHGGVVRWLVVGSVPGAFAGVLVLRALGHGTAVQHEVSLALGGALVLAAALMALRALLDRRARRSLEQERPPVRRLATLLVGVVGGLVVGMTSVGSGSLVIVALMALYPRLATRRLVGTDLVQAVPLVASASLAHLLFGDVRLGLTASLLLGALPGVYVGARLSAGPASAALRPVVGVLVLVSGMRLLGVPPAGVALALLLGALGLTGAWLVRRASRRRDGLTPAAAQPA